MANMADELEPLLPTEYPELWRTMAHAIFMRLRLQGNTTDDVREHGRLAMELTEALADAIGGDTIYIPVGHFFRNDARARALIADCNSGMRLGEAARRHGYTPARAKQLLREWAEDDFNARQGSLPID